MARITGMTEEEKKAHISEVRRQAALKSAAVRRALSDAMPKDERKMKTPRSVKIFESDYLIIYRNAKKMGVSVPNYIHAEIMNGNMFG